MKYILKKQECDTTVLTLIAVSAVSTLYSLILPGALSSGVKWYILKKNTGKGTNVFSSMLYNQVSEVAIMTLMGLAGLAIISWNNNYKVLFLSLFGISVDLW